MTDPADPAAVGPDRLAVRTVSPPRRRRRGHAAAGSRWAVAGLSAGATFGMVTAMAWPATQGAAPESASGADLLAAPVAAPAPSPAASTAPAPVQRIVRVVRVDTSASPPAAPSPRVVTITAPAPAATPAPAPAPAPVARSSSS